MNSSGQSSSSCNSANSSIKNSNVLLIKPDFCFWDGIHLSITTKKKNKTRHQHSAFCQFILPGYSESTTFNFARYEHNENFKPTGIPLNRKRRCINGCTKLRSTRLGPRREKCCLAAKML